MMKCVAAICLTLCCGAAVVKAEEAGARSTAAGVFTKEQAASGEAAYGSHCVSCHGMELRGTDPEVPDLTDGPFKFGWLGKTVAEKFTVIRDTMPLKNGRSLDDQMYLDIVTYILRFNNIPAGSQKLTPDLDRLKQIVIR